MADVRAVNSSTGLMEEIQSTGKAMHVRDQAVIDAIAAGSTTILGTKARQTKVGSDAAPAWAASALVDTIKIVDWSQPTTPVSEYIVEVLNPSSITDLACAIYNLDTSLGSETRQALLLPFTVPKCALTLVENCEDAWNEQVVAEITSALDNVDYKVGSGSAKITAAAAFATGVAASEAFSALNLTGMTHIRAWIKSDVATAAGDLQILLSNQVNCASPLETLNVPALAAGVWTKVRLRLANPASGIGVVSIGLKIAVDKGAQNIWIDDVQAYQTQTRTFRIGGLFVADGGARITFDNTTVLGALDEFTAYARIREA